VKTDPAGAAPETADTVREWIADFDAAARRPLALRFRYAFIHTYSDLARSRWLFRERSDQES